MSDLNKVQLIGRLGADPEVRQFANGGSVANLSVATGESWKDKTTGEKQEKTEWHRVAIFGKLADIAGQYLRKGSQVYLEGTLRTRKWQDNSGQDRYTTEVVVQGFGGTMIMLGSKGDGQQDTRPARQSDQPRQLDQPARTNGPPADDFDEDVPF